MKKYTVEFGSPDNWYPTKEQLQIFIEAGISNAVRNGMGLSRYFFNVEEIKETK